MTQTSASWPPTLTKDPEILGYLTDINKCEYSRDIGRSFTLGGNLYHHYGDTFCKDSTGKFVGLVSNTASKIVNKSKPLESAYLSIDKTGLVVPFLAQNEEEKQYAKDNPGHRPTLWAFGGVAEVDPGVGLFWYEKGIDHNSGETYECLGIGLARVVADPDTGKLSTERLPGVIFAQDEPHFGAVFMENKMIYLYGQKPGGCNIAITRVPKDSATWRSSYQFWDGSTWSSGSTSKCATVYADMPQGGIFRSNLFGSATPYIFVGVSKFGDSKIRVGRAKAPEGPWDIQVAGTAKGINHPDGYMYCIYAHPWAITDKPGALMVTWSEHWPGGVVAAKLSFKLETATSKQEL